MRMYIENDWYNTHTTRSTQFEKKEERNTLHRWYFTLSVGMRCCCCCRRRSYYCYYFRNNNMTTIVFTSDSTPIIRFSCGERTCTYNTHIHSKCFSVVVSFFLSLLLSSLSPWNQPIFFWILNETVKHYKPTTSIDILWQINRFTSFTLVLPFWIIIEKKETQKLN